MKNATDEERLIQRVANVSAWLDVIVETAHELEGDVLSRPSETASEAGADPDPRVVICRHPKDARMGRLCLLCDNTGFASAKEVEGEPVDPYLVDPPREVWAVRRDESESARRARNAEHLDAMIASLQRNVRLRAGAEVHEGDLRRERIMRALRSRLGKDGRHVLSTLEKISPPTRLLVLRREPRALLLFAALVVRGRRLRAP